MKKQAARLTNRKPRAGGRAEGAGELYLLASLSAFFNTPGVYVRGHNVRVCSTGERACVYIYMCERLAAFPPPLSLTLSLSFSFNHLFDEDNTNAS